MRNRGITRVFLIIAFAWCCGPARVSAAPQNTGMGNAPVAHSSCFGSSIEKIRFPGMGASDQQMLREVTRMHEGETLDRPTLQQALRAVFATGRFADLKAECERTPDGGAIVSFVTSSNFFVGRVAVEGAPPRPTESQIVNASKLQLGQLFAADKLTAAIQNIQHLMQQNGYYHSSISHTENQNPETQQIEIIFTIRAGEQAHIGDVSFEGPVLYSRGQLEDIGHFHPGDLITAQTSANAIERIRKAYQKKRHWLAQVRIASSHYQDRRNVVDYVWQIDPGPAVQILVQGFHLSGGTILRNVPVYEEGALDDDLLNEGRRNLLSYMESQGYFEAEVGLRRESDDKQNTARVIYQISPGERHKVVKIEITGNKYFRDEDLRNSMQVQEATLLLSHGRYSEALLRSDVRDIENKFRANGFAQVKVSSRVQDDYRGAKNQLAITLQIDSGPQTLVGSFQISGNAKQKIESFPPLNTQPGQPFSDNNIAQDRDILLNYYFDNGYPDASFEATAKPVSDNRVDVTFQIHEGERVYVDQVLVSGREYTRPYVINRELQVRSGDALSQTSMLETQQKLYDTGIFSQVDTAIQNPEGAEPRKNVLVQLRESKRYTFNYGGGFEFQTGQPAKNEPLGPLTPLVSFDVTRLNFRGRDHTITFQSRVGGLQQRGLISYEAPQWFNNPKWKLTLTAFFDHTLDVQTFTSQRLEGLIQAGEALNKFTTIDYRFNYRLVKALNINPELDPAEIPILSQSARLGEPGFGFIRNRRDNDLETTRGSYLTVDAGVASSYFGSQADFSRILIQYSTYHPFGKKRGSGKGLVFARSTRIGVENPFGNTVIRQPSEAGNSGAGNSSIPVIPLPERFLMGGGNSHRGFGLNQAGPRAPATGDPLGGSALFLNNFELRFPPPTLPFVQDNMSFAIFHDMGNVFTDGTHMLDSLLRWHQNKKPCGNQALNTPPVEGQGASLCDYNYISHAIGIGVRYKTPVGPVRFDFGYNLNPTVYPDFHFTPATSTAPATYDFKGTKQATPFNVYFSIGQTF